MESIYLVIMNIKKTLTSSFFSSCSKVLNRLLTKKPKSWISVFLAFWFRAATVIFLNSFGLVTQVKADNSSQQFITFDLLNKLSAKKHRIKVPMGSAYLIQDIRIVPRSCQKIKDEIYKVDIYRAHVEIFLEQESGEPPEQRSELSPILLHEGELSSNLLAPSSPVEHPIYDLILVACN